MKRKGLTVLARRTKLLKVLTNWYHTETTQTPKQMRRLVWGFTHQDQYPVNALKGKTLKQELREAA